MSSKGHAYYLCMKPIVLVPTDFSENALLAARFAISLAAHSQAEVCFLHAFTWLRSAFQGEHENEANRKEAEQNASQEMDRFLANFTGVSKVPDSVVTEGYLPDAIDRFLSGSNVKLVVMGTTGASGLKYHVLGSSTFEVAKQLKTVPLVVVPPGILRFNLEKVAFFTDFNPGDLQTIASLKAVFPSFSGVIRLIHFGKPGGRPEEEAKLAKWAQTLKNEVGIAELSWLWVEGEEGVEAIRKLNEDFDLLVLTQVEHSFFEKLFSKSMARELIHQSQIPVFMTSTAMH